MNAKNLKRLESSWLLRDFAWSLKRLADRYERCCMHDANDDDERKAKVWVDRAKERLAKFRASRAEYFRLPMSIDELDKIISDVFKQSAKEFFTYRKTPKRNPWRAGMPMTGAGQVKILATINGCRSVVEMNAASPYATLAEAWRPA